VAYFVLKRLRPCAEEKAKRSITGRYTLDVESADKLTIIFRRAYYHREGVELLISIIVIIPVVLVLFDVPLQGLTLPWIAGISIAFSACGVGCMIFCDMISCYVLTIDVDVAGHVVLLRRINKRYHHDRAWQMRAAHISAVTTRQRPYGYLVQIRTPLSDTTGFSYATTDAAKASLVVGYINRL
jgi:hypothetical protein